MTDVLNPLTLQELGRLFPIIITDYDPGWVSLFLNEKQNILNAVETTYINRIEDLGSTAVPGLCTKPTIDNLIEISDNTNHEIFINSLQKNQYQYIPKPDNPPPHITLAKGYSQRGLTGQILKGKGLYDQ